MITMPTEITVVHHSKPTMRCAKCGGNQFGLSRHRLHCTLCGCLKQKHRGAIHIQRVMVDRVRANWPLRNRTVMALDYDRIGRGLPTL